VFAVCVFPIHVWSFISLLSRLSGLMLKLNPWELIGTIAYVQTFALLESMSLLLILVILAAVLPARLLRDRFVAKSSILVLLTSAIAIAIHYELIHWWRLCEFLAGLASYLLLAGALCVLIQRYERFEKAIQMAADRLAVLSSAYVCVDLLSVITVVIRNI
jgi:hypothetical protein